jgi:hypothetical protein
MPLGALSLDHRESFFCNPSKYLCDSRRLCIRCDPTVFLVFLSR